MPPTSSSAMAFRDDERINQAIVIADSFNERFMPITLDKPRCLLPLINVPIIEYTLEFLAVSGIQEVILFCRSHADQIKDYVNRSRWNRPTSTLTIQVIQSPECCSVGDALRDIDAKSLITGDFVLCSGDVVSNMNLGPALINHQIQRKADKNMIMTMCLKECDPKHRTREHCEGAFFVIDTASGECLAYEPIESEERDARHSLSIDLASKKALSFRYDLMDCEIDICAQNVLALFTENFDYMDVRRDFCRGVLTSDLLGHSIMTAIMGEEEPCGRGFNGYAARVRNPRLYDAISRDIVGRWTFPIVPDSDLIDEQNYRVSRGMIYQGEGVIMARSSVIGNNTVLGGKVSIGENTKIIGSVLGKNVQIGANCVIEGAYIWEGVIIESNCIIQSSIISDNARIKSNTIITPGCLITADVIVGPRVTLPVGTRVAKWTDRMEAALNALSISEDLDPVILQQAASTILGSDSDGVVWSSAISSYEGDVLEEEHLRAYSISSEYIRKPMKPIVMHSDEDDEDDEEHQGDHDMLFADQDREHFSREAYEMARNSIISIHSIDNAALELNSLKFACNASFADCRRALLRALLSCTDCHTQDQFSSSVTSIWGRWCPLLSRFTFTEEDQLSILVELCNICRLEGHVRAFQYIVPILYQYDVADGDVVCSWFHGQETDDVNLSRFVKWLEESDEEDEDEDE